MLSNITKPGEFTPINMKWKESKSRNQGMPQVNSMMVSSSQNMTKKDKLGVLNTQRDSKESTGNIVDNYAI